MRRLVRIFSFMMAFVLLFTNVNITAFAAEVQNTVSGNEVAITEKTEVSVSDNAAEDTETENSQWDFSTYSAVRSPSHPVP